MCLKDILLFYIMTRALVHEIINQDSEIKELKKQMAIYRSNGNDSLDEKVVSK
jgi:hypothetical protein